MDITKLTPAQLAQLQKMLTPKSSKYWAHQPTTKQSAFLLLDCLEALYGGAAGGGKSDALLMAALQYVDQPGYAAILFRKSYADLSLPGALMDRARQWLSPYPEIHWSEKKKTYTFPSGATVSFGYLDSPTDKYAYQGSEFQFIGFDELTQIAEDNYRYLFSRLRRTKGMNAIPLRIRAASNPGGIGHTWVKNRFIDGDAAANGRIFIAAGISDNPYLNEDEYARSLANLDPVTREQLLRGDWNVKKDGALFKREWFDIVDVVPAKAKRIRFWDFATTKPSKKNPDPDYSVGLKLAKVGPYFYIEDIRRFRATPTELEQIVYQTAVMDGYNTSIRIEQEPGSSGEITVNHFVNNVLRGFTARGHRVTGSKIQRAERASIASGKGLVKIKSGPWLADFFDEIEAFPDGPHDDQVDGFSGAFDTLQSSLIPYALPIQTGSNGSSYWREA